MRRTITTKLFSLLFLAIVVTPCLHAAEIRISVAASMSDVFKELTENFSNRHPNVTILPNFGPSGGLAKQIMLGAPADLYISANPKWMDYLVEENLVAPTAVITFAHNSLVFVGAKDNKVSSLRDLLRLPRIGLGSPKSVPAGQYAQQALEKTGLYQQLHTAGKLVMAKDVRQALIYADRGETDGSFVYKTDARLAAKAAILFTVPQELYNRVTYPLALTKEGAAKPAARALLTFINSQEAKNIIKKYGFSLPEEPTQ